LITIILIILNKINNNVPKLGFMAFK